ncbi:hypothetical protein HPB52_007219 [Rhipicephalus sanguineus]|uniref:Peptidase M13 C-terminal domain-containing protein n=1 Tax=Rhipicephalus sanguineus TaxID=34632 RepID=A0A9D4PQZ0_RHISA|nr:hypothetical protein HPB52_007219 [Rhipicephalus sanguineus]
MARGGKKLPGRGGHRGRLRGGRRRGHRGRPRGAHRGGHHNAQGHGRGHHQGGARRGWPAGPGRRRLRGHWRQRPSRVGLFPGTKRETKSVAARDDMNFVDEADKLSAAIADAIEAGSSTSSEESVQGPPLKLGADKIRHEEARKQTEAEEMRLKEEKARWLSEAQEQVERKRKEARRMEEEARKHKEQEEKKQDKKKQDEKKQDEKKQDEEAVRRRKKNDPKEHNDEEARFRRMEQRKEEEEARRFQRAQTTDEAEDRRLREQLVDEDEDALQRLEERRKEEEEKIRLLKEERKRLEEESAIQRREEEQKILEAQRVTTKAPTKKDTPVIEKTESISPITRQIMDVVDDIEKMSTNPERPVMVEASTETVDIPYQRPHQVRMPEYDAQAAPMLRPVASYVIKRPRSETRLQRLLSFFGLASPHEPDQEVIEYSFIEPTARWSLYEEQQDRPVRYGGGYQRQRKASKKTRRQGEYDESPESSGSEESPDELEEKVREDDICKRPKERSGCKKKSTQRRNVQKEGGPTFGKTAEAHVDRMDKPKVSPTGAATQRVSDSMRALRELSYLEVTGRSEVPDIDSLCLRAMETMLPLCLVNAAALPLIHEGTALWQRRWLSDLEVAFLQALPRVPWLDERALLALAFRLRRIRVDPPFSIDQVQENALCLPADLEVGNTLADILGLFREMRTRRSILEQRSGPDWYPLSPLRMWPYFDAGLRRVGIPQGLLNDSVPANSSIFAFHLARVAVRFYASMVPLLYSSFEYDREAALDLGPDSKRVLEGARRCLEEDWRALSKRDAEMVSLPYGLLDDRAWWLRRWLLEQTLAIELALHAFRELLDVRRIWKLQYRFVTLPDYTSTQLFFMYYALDHCEKDYEGFERRQFLQRKRPPAKMRVNLPLRHVGAFADAFGCKRGDEMIADEPCTIWPADEEGSLAVEAIVSTAGEATVEAFEVALVADTVAATTLMATKEYGITKAHEVDGQGAPADVGHEGN